MQQEGANDETRRWFVGLVEAHKPTRTAKTATETRETREASEGSTDTRREGGEQ